MKIKTVGEVGLTQEQIEHVIRKHISTDLGRMKEIGNPVFLWNKENTTVEVTFDIIKKEPKVK